MTVKMSRSSPTNASSSGGNLRLAVRRLDHDAQRDRLGERELLPPNPFPHHRIDQLEVHVGDPLGELLDDLRSCRHRSRRCARCQGTGSRTVGRCPSGTARYGPGCRRGCRRAGGTPARRRIPRSSTRPNSLVPAIRFDHCSGSMSADSSNVPVCMSVYCSGSWIRYFAPTSVSSFGFPAEVGDRLVQCLFSLVQPGEDGAAADLQATLIQLVTQLLRVLRKESLRAELGPDVTGVGDVIEVLLPTDLLRVLGEPHTPRIGRRAQPEPGQVGGCHVLDLLGSGGGAGDPATGCSGRRVPSPTVAHHAGYVNHLL